MLKNSILKCVRPLIVVASILAASSSQAQIKYYLETGNTGIGWVSSVDMSKMSAPGNTHTQNGSTTIVLTNTTPQLLSWMHVGVHSRSVATCSILMIGPNGKEMEKLTFTNPSLISVTLPAMSNIVQLGNQASISIVLHTASLATIAETTQTPPAFNNQPWVGNKFALTITGLDCTGITKVSSISFHNPLVDDNGNAISPSTAKVPVNFSVSGNSANSFTSWFNDFSAGKPAGTTAKPCTLVMSYDTGATALTVDFANLLITSFNLNGTGGVAGCTINDITIH